MVLIAWLALAAAQSEPEPPDASPTSDTASPDVAEPDDEPLVDPFEQMPSAELVVYGERLVDQARREVVETIEELGYDHQVSDQGDRTIYRHPYPWYGEVVLYDDGYMRVKRQRIRAEGRPVPWAKKRNSVGAWLGCFVYPWACIRVYGATVSRRRWMGTQSRTVADLQPKVEVLGDRIADLATSRQLAALPDQLQDLWDEGDPLGGRGSRLATKADRRRAILEYWGSRTDTVWGRRVREMVENFVWAVVQDGPDPFTRAELAAFNADRTEPFVIPADPSAEAEATP